MSKRCLMLVITVVFAVAGASRLAAQQAQPGQEPSAPPPQGQRRPMPPPPPDDPLAGSLFPPEMIMQHQRELGLTEEQKTFMRGEIQRTTMSFNELQWSLQDAHEALTETVKGSSVNEQLALQQLDKVLDGEREIKRLHMEMAIRIKNKLTPEQQLKLQTFRQPPRPRRGGPPDEPGRWPEPPPRRPDGPEGPPEGRGPVAPVAQPLDGPRRTRLVP